MTRSLVRIQQGLPRLGSVAYAARMRGTKTLRYLAACWAAAGLFACGGSAPPSEAPEEPPPEPIAETEPAPAPPPEAEAEADPESDAKPPAAEPEFKEGMSVEEAISAVPQGTERENVEQEALSQPLMNAKLYDPCKPKPNQKFRLKVAVWGGRAVGIDVEATPKNDALVECVKEQVRQLEWKEKVKSLNTVEFNY